MDENPPPTPTPEYLANTVPNRTPKAFRLIDQPTDPPDDVLARSRAFIARVRWKFATTMPEHPHEYIVRATVPQALRDAYDRLWHDIQEHGYRGRFGREVKPYMNCDGWRYWSCVLANCGVQNWNAACPHARLGVGCVINRSMNDDLPPRQLSLEVER